MDANAVLNRVKRDYDVVMLCRFGSHLYGTDNPTSDEDYKGIYMPTRREILTNTVEDHINFDTNKDNARKNTEEDIDCELYSLHFFLDMCRKGEMISMDMLHATGEHVLVTSDLWETIRSHRAMFYTTEMKGFVGYARKQAPKYSEKGNRLEAAITLRTYLDQFDPESRMRECWDELPVGEHLKHLEPVEGSNISQFNFCGKCIQDTVKVGYVINMIDAFEKGYGSRARKAQESGGADWKAISHAIRAALQIQCIMRDGDLNFPLKDAEFIKSVKNGEIDIETATTRLDDELTVVEVLSENCPFPPKVDKTELMDILQGMVEGYHFE